MRVPCPEIVDYRVSRTLADAYGDGAALTQPEPPVTVLDVLSMLCVAIGVGVTWFLVYTFRSVILP
ncbi:hypothetical protein [Ralstonia syzygii]|uniref:hypothetical protein n=1 Tax=Ralstonia syzygii TaxID=28097 RepID=UPI0035146A18